MNVEDYDIEDFACDHSFQQYCREEDDSSVAFWNGWISEHPEKAKLIASAKQLVAFLSAGQGNRLEQLSHLKTGLQQRNLLEASIKSTPAAQPNHTGNSRKYLTALAACFAVGVLGYFLISNNPISSSRVHYSDTEYSSTAADRKTVILPDGSIVTLNKNSSISLTPQFSKTKRELTLTGEGFFEVSHDAKHPFFVHTEAVTVKVLGTTFNLRAYPQTKGETETVLFKGKVEVIVKAKPTHKYVLKPNEKFVTKGAAEKAAAPSISLKPTILPDKYLSSSPKETAWLRNRLELNNERLEDIAHRLEKWYGIEIEFGDNEVKSYRYSGTFESETVLRALEALQLSYPFKIESENEKIIISK